MNIFIWQFAVHWLTTPHLPKLLFMLSCISFLCSYRQFCFYIHVTYIGMILCFKLGATYKRKQSLSFWHGLTHLKWWCPVAATAFHNSQSFLLYCIFVLFYMCLCIYVMKYNAHMIIHIPLCMLYIYMYIIFSLWISLLLDTKVGSIISYCEWDLCVYINFDFLRSNVCASTHILTLMFKFISKVYVLNLSRNSYTHIISIIFALYNYI